MQSTNLEQTLKDFQEKANAHASIKSLLKGWEPTIILESTDTRQVFSLKVRNQQIESIQNQRQSDDHEILVQGTAPLLADVFCGKTNPALAHLDGALGVFGSDRDQVKLDSISLILWGF